MKITIKKSSSRLPAISTASLPDIVFILLFFFMTVTVMDDKNLLVDNELPKANETEKLIAKNGVITIYIGAPTVSKELLGSEPRIQMNGMLVTRETIGGHILSELSKMPESLRKAAIISLEVDKKVPMGIVNDVKEELKKIGLPKLNYATFDGDVVP